MVTEFGKICRKLRIDANELLGDMAEKLGVSASFLSAVENGKKPVPDEWVDLITMIYSLELEEKNKLKEAALDTVKMIKIQASEMSNGDKDLVLSFARGLSKLDNDSKEKILKLLK